MTERPPTNRIGAIVLAAGGSSRLGYSKQLIQFEKTSLVRRAALAARAAGAKHVVVVAGADAEKVLAEVADIDGITACVNAAWQTGLASSLKFGLRKLRDLDDIDGVLVTVADQPRIGANLLSQMIHSFTSGHRLVAATYMDVVGVPALFGREYFAALGALSGDRGAGSLLREHAGQVTTIAMPEGAFDIDTIDDVNHLTSGDIGSE